MALVRLIYLGFLENFGPPIFIYFSIFWHMFHILLDLKLIGYFLHCLRLLETKSLHRTLLLPIWQWLRPGVSCIWPTEALRRRLCKRCLCAQLKGFHGGRWLPLLQAISEGANPNL